MFKVFKHDFKSSYKEFLILDGVWIFVTVILGIAINLFFNLTNTFSIFVLVGAFMAYIFALCASVVLIIVFIVKSINQKFFTKEGYLTFSLPISVDKLMISKILVNIFWIFFEIVIFLLSLGIILLFTNNLDYEGIAEVGSYIAAFFENPIMLLVTIFKILLSLLVFLITIFLILAFLTSIHVRSGRVIIAILVYGVITSVVTNLCSLLSYFSIALCYDGESYTFQFIKVITTISQMSYVNESGSIMVFSLNYSLLLIGYIVGAYFLTRFLLKRRLELN